MNKKSIVGILTILLLFLSGCASGPRPDEESVYYSQGWKKFTVFWNVQDQSAKGTVRLVLDENLEKIVDAADGRAVFPLPGYAAESAKISYLNERGKEFPLMEFALELDLQGPALLQGLEYVQNEDTAFISWQDSDARYIYFQFSDSETAEDIDFELDGTESSFQLDLETLLKYNSLQISSADKYGNITTQNKLLLADIFPQKTWDPMGTKYDIVWEKGIVPDGTLSGVSASDEVFDGQIALADTEQGKIILITKDGEIVSEIVTRELEDSPFAGPQDICRFSDTLFIVLDRENARVLFFDAGLDVQKSFPLRASGDKFKASPQSVVFKSGHIYVTDSANRTIKVFNPEGVLTDSFGSGVLKSPYGISAFNDGRIIVGDRELSVLFVFSQTGELLDRWGGFGPGKGKFLDPLRLRVYDNVLYAADHGKSEIHKFDINGHDQGSIFAGVPASMSIKEPDSLLVLADGMVLVGDSGKNQLRLYDSEMVLVKDFEIFRQQESFYIVTPECMAERDGLLYVLDTGRRQVLVLDRLTGDLEFSFPSTRSGGPSVLYRPEGMAIDPDGNVYISDSMLNSIIIYTFDGIFREQHDFSYDKKERFLPGKLAFDKNLGLLIASRKNNSVYSFRPDEDIAFPKVFISGVDNPRGYIQSLIVNDGYIYIIDKTSGKILIYDENGLLVDKSGDFLDSGPKAGSPRDIAFDPYGNLYLLNRQRSRISKFNADEYLGDITDSLRMNDIFNPYALCTASDGGFLFIADNGNKKITACRHEIK